jgi:hypothetical protein
LSRSLLEMASDIQLPDLREYLRLRGWTPVEHRNSLIEVYRKTEESVRLDVVVPRTPKITDFAARVAEAVTTLAAIAKQTPEAILTQIAEISEDVLRASVLTTSITERQSIPLDMAVSVIGGLKKLLTYSAAGEVTALPFYSRPTKKAVAHVEHCRFGHTFTGSFGFTIESPLTPDTQDPLLPEIAAPPFERRVMERLYRGLDQVRQATDAHDLTPIIANYATGLSANMCDALLDITQSATNQEVIFVVDWSPKVAVDSELVAFGQGIRVGQSAIEYLQAASTQLRRLEESRLITIDGRIVLLKSDSQPWEDEPDDPHTVVIAWLDADGKAVRTRVVLAPADYITACNAHMQGMTVSVSGTLERRGKYTRLLNPVRFGPGLQGSLPTELSFPKI